MIIFARLRTFVRGIAMVLWLALAAAPFVSAQQNSPVPQATATVEGTVVDASGEVCEGAHISLLAHGATARTAISDANGMFVFALVPTGNFTVQVTAEGFGPKTVMGTAAPGQTLSLAAVTLTPETSTDVEVSGSDQELATQELRLEEKQRVFGIVPNFDVVYDFHAPPLSARQKYQLALRMTVDPFTFLATGLAAGIEQADDQYAGYGAGAYGYARRYGAAYGNNAIGTLIGNGLLPSVLHQDPRYFYKGTGTKTSRALYAIAASVICKGDNGHWQPNYSSVLGNFAAAGISNSYYPAGDRNGAMAITENVGLSTMANAFENIMQEFVVRHFTHHAPSYDNSAH